MKNTLVPLLGEGQVSQTDDENALCVWVLPFPLLPQITAIISDAQS